MEKNVSSSLSTLIDDGEKIASHLIPPGSSLERVVGALILHVEQAAGHRLESLADDVLGIASPEEAPSGAAPAGTSAGVTGAAVEPAPAPLAAAGVTDAPVTEEPAPGAAAAESARAEREKNITRLREEIAREEAAEAEEPA